MVASVFVQKNKTIFCFVRSVKTTQLFFRVLMDNFAEMASVVYTPTVGWACLNYSRMFRVARGMYFSSRDRGHMTSIAYNWPSHDVRTLLVQ